MNYLRGEIVVLVAPGDFGKPRPAVIVQADDFNVDPPSYSVCLFTTDLKEVPMIRPTVIPTRANGLRETAQIMADRVITVKADKIKQKIGKLSALHISDLNASLRLWLNL